MIPKMLVAASTQPLVLGLLANGESYGYALIQQIRELSGNEIQWTEGMLYPFLHWMEKEGLIQSEWKETEAGRRRKYYRLTPQGRKTLRTERGHWITVHNSLSTLWKTIPHLT